VAQIVLTDASVEVNSVDLSDHVTQVVLNYEVDAVEVTAMSDGAHKFTGGLTNVSATIDFQQDFEAASVDATIEPLVGSTTTVIIKPTSSAVGATNPSYTLTGTYVASHTPLNASVGDLSTTSVEFQGGTLARATT
jgi:hypothetical protein